MKLNEHCVPFLLAVACPFLAHPRRDVWRRSATELSYWPVGSSDGSWLHLVVAVCNLQRRVRRRTLAAGVSSASAGAIYLLDIACLHGIFFDRCQGHRSDGRSVRLELQRNTELIHVGQHISL